MYVCNHVMYLQDNRTLLHYTAQCGSVKIVELLIDQYGMDPPVKSEVHTYVANYIYAYSS